jgi:hypothetical protein
MRMRQSLAELERAFVEETYEDRTRREELREQAILRSRQRQVARRHRHGSFRFALLVLALIGTAVLVTIGMFEALYYVMG